MLFSWEVFWGGTFWKKSLPNPPQKLLTHKVMRFFGRNFCKKFLPNPLQKPLKQGFESIKFQGAVPRSERIAGFVSLSNSFPHWRPQVLGTPKTPQGRVFREKLLRKVSPKPSSKAFEAGFYLAKFQAALPRSERIAGAVSFSDSFPHWLPQVLGTPTPKTPNDTSPEAPHEGKTRSRSEHITS